MSQLARLGHDVSFRIKSRGKQYFKRGAVGILYADPDFVSASVRGERKYEVDLEREGDYLVYSCDCPYHEGSGQVCKHVWATLLHLESTGFLNQWSRSFPKELIPAESDEEPALEYAGDYGLDEEEDPWPAIEPIKTTGGNRSQGPHFASDSWQTMLKRVMFTSEVPSEEIAWPADREILYFLTCPTQAYTEGLKIGVYTREPKKTGGWKTPKPLSLSQNLISCLPDPSDRDILSRLVGVNRVSWLSRHYESTYLFSPSRHDLMTLLPLISETGRLFLHIFESDELRLVHWDTKGPWEFCIEAHSDPKGLRYEIRGAFHRGNERLSMEQAEYLLEEGILVCGESIAAYKGSFRWVSIFRNEGPFFVPRDQADEWIEAMIRTPGSPRLELPEELRLEDMHVAPKLIAQVRAVLGNFHSATLSGEVIFEYNGHLVNEHDPRTSIALVAERKRIPRDRNFEHQALIQFEKAGFKRTLDSGGRKSWSITPSRLPAAVRDLVSAGWHVEAEGKLFRKPGSFEMNLHSGIDWFELRGTAEFGSARVSLPKLLSALKRRENTILLDDGTYGVLPEEWLRKYGMLASLGLVHEDHIRFKHSQACLLDALLAEQPEVRCDRLFERIRTEIQTFDGIAPAAPPVGFQGTLRPYQHEGLGWFHFLQKFGFGGCLADDMGLGKTVQVLALLEERRALRHDDSLPDRLPPSLVVMPRSLLFNWKQEAERFAPKLRVLEHTGGVRIRSHEHFDDYDAVFTTYGTLRRDAAFFKDKLFDYVILDEAQAIKNSSTESAKAARLLRSNHRLALSGTPIENHLGELWSLFEFLNPGMLGEAGVFKSGKGATAGTENGQAALLSQALRPFILRRTKAQVARDLPAKVEQTLFCQLEPAQRALYNELRDHYRKSLLRRIEHDGMGKSKIHILEALLRLRQAAIHPGLIDPARVNEPSAKLDMLLPQLLEVLEEGHKALVFSQFTSMLAILRSRLDMQKIRYEYLDGQTLDRASPVERFQNDPESMLFLISLKAGGLGLNLTAAEYVFLLDPWWNPAVEAQAVDRTHRIGQTRSVFAYRLIAKDTVEEKVLQLQESKRELADAIINENNSLLRDLKAEDLAILLG